MKNKISVLFMAIVMCFSLCTPVWAAIPAKDAALVDEPYVETAHAYGENALSVIKDTGTKQKLLKKMEDMQLELVQVTTKTVYVEEGYNETGEFTSKILNKAEAEQFKNVVEKYNAGAGNSVNGSESKTNRGALTITLSYLRDAHYNYVLEGDASWAAGSGAGASYPSGGEDYMAIRWGGDNEYLKAKSSGFIGVYRGQVKMPGYQALANSYGGYCWSFEEYSSGKTMESAGATVVMRNTYSTSQGREAGATLTYIHTYEELSASATISFNGSGERGVGITLSSCSKQWPLSVAVDGIKF